MRAVANDGGIRTVDVEEPRGDGVRVSVVAAGICGTDIGFVQARYSGFVYGHEFAGHTDDGRRVFVEPTVYGGRCAECLRGDTARCTEPGHGNLGIFIDGGMAERVVVPEYVLLDLPDGLDVGDAFLIEPRAVAWRAIRRAQVAPGERLLVLGGGTIGVLAAACAARVGLPVESAAMTTSAARPTGWEPAGPTAAVSGRGTHSAPPHLVHRASPAGAAAALTSNTASVLWRTPRAARGRGSRPGRRAATTQLPQLRSRHTTGVDPWWTACCRCDGTGAASGALRYVLTSVANSRIVRTNSRRSYRCTTWLARDRTTRVCGASSCTRRTSSSSRAPTRP